MGLRDAAFVYFVQGGASYLNAARTALLAQTTVTGTKFENGARWCTSAADATNTGLGNTIGAWVRRLAYAYSYIKPALSTADQTTLIRGSPTLACIFIVSIILWPNASPSARTKSIPRFLRRAPSAG